jgi:hypothetical protein
MAGSGPVDGSGGGPQGGRGAEVDVVRCGAGNETTIIPATNEALGPGKPMKG